MPALPLNPMRALPLLLILVLPLLAAGHAAANEDHALLRALAAEEEQGSSPALTPWRGLGEVRQIEILREALHGEDEELAMIAARGLGPEYLSWAEPTSASRTRSQGAGLRTLREPRGT